MIKRILLSISLGGLIAAGLFTLMAKMIAMDGEYKRPDTEGVAIEFLRVSQKDDVENRKRQLPKKPPPPKAPPQTKSLKVANQQAPSTPQLQMDIPKMSNLMAGGDGPFLGESGGSISEGDVLPLVRIEPQYPRQAAMQGLEGWVLLEFDITPTGHVENVKILDAKPNRVFNSSARRALEKWKYKPKIIDGKPELQTGLKVKLEFKLEG
ncbi:MAG: energy transducer TonB [Bdellovibrionales bacterium]|nr:energy transducer TonB [Bdellovibrionales bacterium]